MRALSGDDRHIEDLAIGEAIYDLAAQIYPICRSITGDGVRHTLGHLAQHIGLTTHEVPTGTNVFDWTIPREWNMRDACIRNAAGERVVDFRKSNLHVVGYSVPVHATLPLHELKQNIFTLPDQPDLIPYRTSYYSERWGFCMQHRQLEALPEGDYEVMIDSSLEDGSLTYGEYLHRGASEEEVLLSAHICHPSLANDNCSGLALLTEFAKRLSRVRTRFSYRFVFAPGTIGAITWLARNEDRVDRIKHGLVVSCVGDDGGPTYKRSRRGDALIDRAMAHVLRHAAPNARVLDYFPYGYDERQYCSLGFNLPVGLFQRSQFGSFPQYHTSADDLTFIKPESLAASYRMLVDAMTIIEENWVPRATMTKCEPQLGRRGLYSSVGGHKDGPAASMAFLWLLNFADGDHSVLDIANRANMPFGPMLAASDLLERSGLVERSAPASIP